MESDLFSRLLTDRPPPFALVHRTESDGPGTLDVLVGEVSTPDSLAGIELPPASPGRACHDVLALVPYAQVVERGFTAISDGAPLLSINITEQEALPVRTALSRLPQDAIALSGGGFDIDDDAYADIVREVVTNEIGEGNGANFVIKRTYVADITDYGPHSAMAFFRALLERESGAYWTFIVHTGSRTLAGASPERHIRVQGGTAVMNPISGTYRYPPSGPELDGVLGFLADRKEAEELYMVVDEELKMMTRVCSDRVRVIGPRLKEMARLAHTEYYIEGRSDRDPRAILRDTMFAPTVTGSPLESACRVIARYEPEGRGYYSGVLALFGRDEHGGRTLDSSILIRTADIDSGGHVRIGVGATLVRHSDPDSEVAETKAKASGLLAALNSRGSTAFGEHPTVHAALRSRNTGIAGFWLADGGEPVSVELASRIRDVLVVDAEDAFTSMLECQLRALELRATVRRFDEVTSFDGYDLVVLGPGPGDPRRLDHPKIGWLHEAIGTLVNQRRPMLAVCLSHQVLCRWLGLEVRRRDVPNQGIQREIDFFGTREKVGFYNTFTAISREDKVTSEDAGVVEISRDITSGHVHALRGPGFASMQFHAESLLTRDGVRIIAEQLKAILES